MTQRAVRPPPEQPAPAAAPTASPAPVSASAPAGPGGLRRRLPAGRHASQQVHSSEYILPSFELAKLSVWFVFLLDVLVLRGDDFFSFSFVWVKLPTKLPKL